MGIDATEEWARKRRADYEKDVATAEYYGNPIDLIEGLLDTESGRKLTSLDE